MCSTCVDLVDETVDSMVKTISEDAVRQVCVVCAQTFLRYQKLCNSILAFAILGRS